MKRLACILLALACAARLSAMPPEERWVTPEEEARYSAPGDTARYVALITMLRESEASLEAPTMKLKMPVRAYPSGKTETMLFAEIGWTSADMMQLRGKQVRVENYREDGTLVATLTADEAAVDRTAKLAVAKGHVRIERDGDVLTGNGALADFDAEYVKMLKDAVIETDRLQGMDLTKRGMF